MKSFTKWIEEFEGSPDNIHFTIALSNYGLSAEQITQARKVFDDDDIPILWWLIDKIKLDQKDAQAVIEILEKDWYDNLDRTTRATPQIEESSRYMNKYKVIYEVRPIGAIGIFEPMTDVVEAKTTGTAAFAAFRKKYEDRYEFRSPVSCEIVQDTTSIKPTEWSDPSLHPQRQRQNPSV